MVFNQSQTTRQKPPLENHFNNNNVNRKKRMSSVRKRDARYMRDKFESENELDLEFDPSL